MKDLYGDIQHILRTHSSASKQAEAVKRYIEENWLIEQMSVPQILADGHVCVWVQSRSDPLVFYRVLLMQGGAALCSCKAAQFKPEVTCHHVKRARQFTAWFAAALRASSATGEREAALVDALLRVSSASAIPSAEKLQEPAPAPCQESTGP